LNIYHNDRRLDHRRHPETFGHQREAAAGRGAHRTHTGVRCADRYIDDADCDPLPTARSALRNDYEQPAPLPHEEYPCDR
jgi:hypothetical protein